MHSENGVWSNNNIHTYRIPIKRAAESMYVHIMFNAAKLYYVVPVKYNV